MTKAERAALELQWARDLHLLPDVVRRTGEPLSLPRCCHASGPPTNGLQLREPSR